MSYASRALALSLILVACGSEDLRLDPPAQPSVNGTDRASQSSAFPRDTGLVRDTSADTAAQTQLGQAPGSPQGNGKKPGIGQDQILAAAAKDFLIPARTFPTPQERLWATFYHTLRFESATSGFDLLTLTGQALGPKLTKLQWCQAAMEGSVQVAMNGVWKTYNYAGTAGSVQVDCSEFYDHPVGRTRFTLARGPYGDGVRNYILAPFRTIAVDPAVIPYGTVIFIPAARGLRFNLSDGSERVHDGYFFAGDTGGLIHDDHIDVFIGNALRSPFPWITSNAKNKTSYQVVPDSDIRDALTDLHILR